MLRTSPTLEQLEDRLVPAAPFVRAALVPLGDPVAAAFPQRRDITTNAAGASSVATADLDDDGDLDVLSASIDDDRIVWYENNGAFPPAFTPHVISSSANGAECVIAADVDGDGDFDVLSASPLDNKIAWYENRNGDGSLFIARTISTTAVGAYSVAVGDLDGDGDLDVLSASRHDNRITWYENNGALVPGFTAHTISNTARGALAVVAADFDGDGDLDVASASADDDKIAWYENTAGNASTFTLRTISLTADGASCLEAADIDGDGDFDLVAGSSLNDTVAWYENVMGNGSLFVQRVVATDADGVFSVAVADVDDDGDLDILSGSYRDNKVAWYENVTGLGTDFNLHIVSTATQGVDSVTTGDLDGDGDTDILSASIDDNRVSWFPNRVVVPVVTGASTGRGVVRVHDGLLGDELFSFTVFNQASYNGGVRVALANFNRDEMPDLIVSSGAGLNGGSRVKVFDGAALLTGTVTELLTLFPYGANYRGEINIAGGDFNSDGRADLVTSNTATGTNITVFDAVDLTNGGTLKPLARLQPFGSGYTGSARLAVGDVNGDGINDIVAGQSKNGSRIVAISGHDFATVLLSHRVLPTGPAGGVFVSVGNVDGDERLDLIVGLGSGVKSFVYVFEDAPNTMTATLLKKSDPVYDPSFKGGVRVAVADLNGDGRVEVLTTVGNGLSPYRLKVLDSQTLEQLDAFFSQGPNFTEGRFVAAAVLG